jgi:2-keto-4-pentenoate hydratase/2-oxohepta-3-ene-1,7-dioic acid hydratase in catechol pathway
MKLIRFGEHGREKPGVQLDNGARKDVSAIVPDWNGATLAGDGVERVRAALAAGGLPDVNAAARTGPCVARPHKIIGIGLNFRDHALEMGIPLPAEPILFLKATSSFSGPNDPIVIPRGSLKTDWEIELGIVIGREARYLDSPAESGSRIAGYCVVNDVSERSFQLERGGQWTKGKSADSFTPVGPWLVTPDEAGDVGALTMRLRVNGQKRQSGSTASMIFDPASIVHYASQFMTLEPGDVITTGSPPGVGQGMKPPRFLKPGDVVELEIERLGRQRQVCAAAR